MTGHHQFRITLLHTAVQTEKHNYYPAEFKLKQCKPRDQIQRFFFSVLDPAQFTELHTCCTAALAGNQTENAGKSFTWMQEDCQM